MQLKHISGPDVVFATSGSGEDAMRLHKDAARYRWLRSFVTHMEDFPIIEEPKTEEEFDHQIDDAMEAK